MAEKRTLTFTDSWLKSITTDKANEVFYDAGTGLSLRVSKTGRKTWQVFYRVKGDPTRRVKKIGDAASLSLKKARTMAAAAVDAANDGHDPARGERAARKSGTFEWLAGEYIERYAKDSKRSWERDLELLERNVLPHWKNRKATQIKRKDVIELLDGIMGRMKPGQKGIPANRTLAVVRKVYNWGISRDLVEANPCAQVDAPASEQARDRVLTDAELRAIWQAFGGLSETMGRLMKFRLLTAQRGGEVESMAWADVDLKGKWWTIPAEKTKNGMSHRVPLSLPAVAVLKELKALNTKESPWVFPSPRRVRPGQEEPVDHHIVNVQKAFDLAIERAGKILKAKKPPDFTPHDLRRTAASHMASLGIQRLTISKVLNHTEAGITKVYDRHSYDAEKREALNAWARRLQEILTVK